jgi:hypothetical protein
MKKSRFASIWIPVLLAGVFLVTACEPQPPAERPAGAETSNPENTAAPSGQVVLAQNLTVLDPATIELMAPVEQGTVTAAALETQTGGVITFPGATKSRIALNPGDVLAAGVTNKTPFGLLRKVTDVNETPAGVEVATEQATLEDAIVEGEFEDHAILELPPSSAQANPGRRGAMQVMAHPAAAQWVIPLKDVVLWDADHDPSTKGDQILASGEILITPEYDFHVKISGISMQKLEFKNKTTIKSTVKIHAERDFVNIHGSIPVYHHFFAPREIPVAGLPVVITPELNVYLGLDGQVSVGISTGVMHTAEITIGANYANGKWDIPKDFNSHFDVIAPTVKNKWQARAYARPRLDLWLYGWKGPYGQLDGYFELDLSPLNNPWWVMYGGIDAEIGVEFKVFKFLKAVKFSQKFQIYRKMIAQAAVSAGSQTPTPQAAPFTVVYDLIGGAPLANWTNVAGPIPWSYSDVDRRGFAMFRPNVRMEDGNVYDPALETHPEWVPGGIISGAYTDIQASGYIVQPQDVFDAVFGFMENARAGEAVFRVMIRPEHGPNEWIGEVPDSYDGQLKDMVIPLAPWAGQRADFILRVDAESSPDQDWATWVVAQIERP